MRDAACRGTLNDIPFSATPTPDCLVSIVRGCIFTIGSKTIIYTIGSYDSDFQIQIGFIVAQINDKHQYTYIYKYKKLQLNKKKN